MSNKPKAEPMPMEKRNQISRHIQNSAASLMHKTNATGVICIVLMQDGSYMHAIDGATGQLPGGSLAEVYRMALGGHERHDAGHEEGWTQ